MKLKITYLGQFLMKNSAVPSLFLENKCMKYYFQFEKLHGKTGNIRYQMHINGYKIIVKHQT